ncbi:cupin-like domain-containing protein [Pseudoduganella sp. RAF53_2]|uniref:cupin-like domain-containing protein n=1 Tax=unclassified Pseudoduganella TaxID=2637179 RepID=UPI003F982D19
MQTPKPMRELAGLCPSDLDDELLTSTEPLVLRGLAAQWPLVQAARTSQRAASDYLHRFYQGEKVVAMLGAPDIRGRFFYNEDLSGFNFASVRTGLGGVLEELEAHRNDVQPPAIYVGSTEVDGCLPGLRTENDLEMGARQPWVSIWLGNQTRIAAHYDLPDNIACVAAGRRRFTLFPPEQLRNLYIGPLDFTPAGQAISLVDFHRPDMVRYPRFAEALAQAQSAELEAGDAIFIPSMWWHQVEALDPFNILVNYWWRQSPGFMDTPTNALMLALMTMRDLPPAQRAAWQELFRHYVFESNGSEAAHIPPNARSVLSPLNDAGARALRGQILNRMNR